MSSEIRLPNVNEVIPFFCAQASQRWISCFAPCSISVRCTVATAFLQLWQIMREGGAFHTRGQLERYSDYLRKTGREAHIPTLDAVYRRRPVVQFRPLYDDGQ